MTGERVGDTDRTMEVSFEVRRVGSKLWHPPFCTTRTLAEAITAVRDWSGTFDKSSFEIRRVVKTLRAKVLFAGGVWHDSCGVAFTPHDSLPTAPTWDGRDRRAAGAVSVDSSAQLNAAIVDNPYEIVPLYTTPPAAEGEDAKRLDWLERTKHTVRITQSPAPRTAVVSVDDGTDTRIYGHRLARAAIDAARAPEER